MTDSRVAKRYAKALFNAALKLNIVQSVSDDLAAITGALRNSEAFRKFMTRPETTSADKVNLLDKTLGDRVTALTLDFVRLLIKKRRDDELTLIQLEFEQLKRDHENVVKAVITSAEELTDDQKERIIATISKRVGRTLQAEFHVDPKLIGGVKVTYDNFVLDGTVRGHLDKLRERLLYDLLKQA